MRNILRHLLLSIFLSQSTFASGGDQRVMEKSYQDGKTFDAEMRMPSLDSLKEKMTGFQHYQGKDVPEANLRAEELEERSKQKIEEGRKTIESGGKATAESTFMTSYLKKKNISISGEEDFIKEADKIAVDPLKHIDENAQFNEVKEDVLTKQWEETCIERGKPFEVVDTTYLSHVALVEKKKEGEGLKLIHKKIDSSDRYELITPIHGNSVYLQDEYDFYMYGKSLDERGHPRKDYVFPERPYDLFSVLDQWAPSEKFFLHMPNLTPGRYSYSRGYRLWYVYSPKTPWPEEFEKTFFNKKDFYEYIKNLKFEYQNPKYGFMSRLNIIFNDVKSSHFEQNMYDFYDNCEKNAYFRRQHHVSVSSNESHQNDSGWQPTTKEDFLLGSQDLGMEQDIWSKQDEGPEILADQGICHYVSSSCVQGHDTRLINGVPVTRPCWAKRRIYQCEFIGKETCAALRRKGCHQVDSRCVQKVQERCASFEQKFVCREKIKTGRKTVIKGKIPFCLDGKCHQVSWEPNQDLTEAISMLALLKQISKDIDANTRTIFKGEALGCVRHCASFSSCCGVGSGWGVSVGLTKCSEDERRLSKIRGEGKCVLVGTYCAEKVLGVCIRKKTNFCCFGSKLARVFHEEARKQLHMGFGSAKHPACQGITFDQLGQLDFSKIDLSEIFNELNASIVKPNCTNVAEKLKQDWVARMPDPEKNSPPQSVPTMAQHIQSRQAQQHPRSVDRTLNYEHANNDFTPPEKDTNEVMNHENSKLVF